MKPEEKTIAAAVLGEKIRAPLKLEEAIHIMQNNGVALVSVPPFNWYNGLEN